YEDGYLTYATDPNAAAIMYAETGSLRQLRSQIRRSPGFDPALEMISGPSLFLWDHHFKTGAGTALDYKRQSARLLSGVRAASPPARFDDPKLVRIVEGCVDSSAQTFEGDSVTQTCLLRAGTMVTMLLRSMP